VRFGKARPGAGHLVLPLVLCHAPPCPVAVSPGVRLHAHTVQHTSAIATRRASAVIAAACTPRRGTISRKTKGSVHAQTASASVMDEWPSARVGPRRPLSGVSSGRETIIEWRRTQTLAP